MSASEMTNDGASAADGAAAPDAGGLACPRPTPAHTEYEADPASSVPADARDPANTMLHATPTIATTRRACRRGEYSIRAALTILDWRNARAAVPGHLTKTSDKVTPSSSRLRI